MQTVAFAMLTVGLLALASDALATSPGPRNPGIAGPASRYPVKSALGRHAVFRRAVKLGRSPSRKAPSSTSKNSNSGGGGGSSFVKDIAGSAAGAVASTVAMNAVAGSA